MSEKLIRTFLSIPVPLEVRSKKNMLYSTLEESPAKINWVKNVQLHLTIKFLSHTPESIIEKIINDVITSENVFFSKLNQETFNFTNSLKLLLGRKIRIQAK